ncbi:MAG: hypothetical protein COA81_03960 [Alphaproteobacteria bacterium]|nr:MAG: hypothetical protein COA81_03960 [Alphaproteobacteria bacterium]
MYKDTVLGIIDKTSHVSGLDFLKSLVLALNELTDFDFVFVAKLEPDTWSAQTLAIASNNALQENFSYSLKNTPCEEILDHNYCSFERNVCVVFPKDHLLKDMSIEAYIGYPLMSVNGQPIGILVLMNKSPIKDVSKGYDLLRYFARRCESVIEQTELENNLNITKTELEKAYTVRESILQNISHELRTPLNAIIGFSDLLGSSNLLDMAKENVKEYLSFIKGSGEDLLSSITDIVDFSALQSGQHTLEITLQEINSLVERCINSKRKKYPNIIFETKNITGKVYARTDAIIFEKLLTNILDNAAKFSVPGSVVKTEISLLKNEQLEITVIDNGIGFNQKDLENLQKSLTFDINVQAKKASGLGLGLAYVKCASQMLDIAVNFDSNTGKGTCVSIVLPSGASDTVK